VSVVVRLELALEG